MSPLEKRYKDLPYEYIERCYVKFYNQPDPEKIRDMLVVQRAKEKKEEEAKKQNENILDIVLGQDEDQKQEILKTLKGMNHAN